MKSPALTRITWIGAVLYAFSCLQPDETPHASSHRNALPVLGNHSCLFVWYTAGLGAVVTGVCVCILGTKQKELLARIHTFSKRWKSFSHLLLKTCGVWGGNDWDSGKTPAFISSSASQELCECWRLCNMRMCYSAISLCQQPACYIYFWLLQAKPASLYNL